MKFHFTKSWGAEQVSADKARFRLWAPSMNTVSVIVGDRTNEMTALKNGWFEIEADARVGDAYAFIVDGKEVADPAARAQTNDVHGRSLITDPKHFDWTCPWQGRPWTEAVIYELHIGTFSPEGTFEGTRRKLDYLADLGVTAIEIMPVAQFSGTRGWGYDGVLFYAPHNAYGTPDDLKRLIDDAHMRGIMVLLDVVYNHFGPEGNYLPSYADAFFTQERKSPWGTGIAYEHRPVRDFIIENALYWLEEFNIDGLRLDASDHIKDPSEPEILVELAQRVRTHGFTRPIHLTTEDNRNVTRLHEPEAGLYDGEWNDDYHHAIHSLLTGEHEGYYKPFSVDPIDDLTIALKSGFIEQGQPRAHQKKQRGEPSGHLPPVTFVNFLQNHDQTGNRPLGERLAHMADKEAVKAVTALHLLSPFIPLIFMGEEWLERAPFLFFGEYGEEMAKAVSKGRKEEFKDFEGFNGESLPEAHALSTFHAVKLDWNHNDEERAHLALVRQLLALRQQHVLPLIAGRPTASSMAEHTGERSLHASWRFPAGELTIRANLGTIGGGSADDACFFSLGALDRDPFALTASVVKVS